jgi:hypothetical protein
LLVTAGRTCDTIKPIDPTLEDVFVALIHREGGAVAG